VGHFVLVARAPACSPPPPPHSPPAAAGDSGLRQLTSQFKDILSTASSLAQAAADFKGKAGQISPVAMTHSDSPTTGTAHFIMLLGLGEPARPGAPPCSGFAAAGTCLAQAVRNLRVSDVGFKCAAGSPTPGEAAALAHAYCVAAWQPARFKSSTEPKPPLQVRAADMLQALLVACERVCQAASVRTCAADFLGATSPIRQLPCLEGEGCKLLGCGAGCRICTCCWRLEAFRVDTLMPWQVLPPRLRACTWPGAGGWGGGRAGGRACLAACLPAGRRAQLQRQCITILLCQSM